MNHDQAEREAVIALWRDVPECRPVREGPNSHLVYDFNHYARRFPDCYDKEQCWMWVDSDWATVAPPTNEHKCCPHGERESTALAISRDVLIDFLEGFGVVKLSRSSNGSSVVHYVYMSRINQAGTRAVNFYQGKAPTRLLALCAAARAVAGGGK